MTLNLKSEPRAIHGWFAVLIGALLFGACDVTSPLEDVSVHLKFSPTETIAVVNIVDGRTGAQLENTRIRIQFSGDLADLVVNNIGESVRDFHVRNGFFSFGLLDLIPSASDPATLYAVVQAEGYLPARLDLVLYSPHDPATTVRLISLTQPPAGVTAATDTGGQSAGSQGTTGEIHVRAGGADVTIAPGTVIVISMGLIPPLAIATHTSTASWALPTLTIATTPQFTISCRFFSLLSISTS